MKKFNIIFPRFFNDFLSRILYHLINILLGYRFFPVYIIRFGCHNSLICMIHT